MIDMENSDHPSSPNIGHGRDQIYSGYLWKGNTSPPLTQIYLAGTSGAFGGRVTGGTAKRSVFGWVTTNCLYPVEQSFGIGGVQWQI